MNALHIVEPDSAICGCGNRGCLETAASVSGLRARAVDALTAGRPSALATKETDALTLDRIVMVSRGGDALAQELLARTARYLGPVIARAVDN